MRGKPRQTERILLGGIYDIFGHSRCGHQGREPWRIQSRRSRSRQRKREPIKYSTAPVNFSSIENHPVADVLDQIIIS